MYLDRHRSWVMVWRKQRSIECIVLLEGRIMFTELHLPSTTKLGSSEFSELLMKFFAEVELTNFKRKKHELDFVKLLFKAAPALRRMGITCHHSFAGWEKLSEDLQSFALVLQVKKFLLK